MDHRQQILLEEESANPYNIRTELKQSIGNTGSKGRHRKDLLHTKSAYTRCGVNQQVLMENQQDQIPSHGQGVQRGGLHR